jgi:hypothetical protein
MTVQPSGMFRNPATGEIECTGEDRGDAWRSNDPVEGILRERFDARDRSGDEFCPEGGGWQGVYRASLDAEQFLIVTGVGIADWDKETEE